MEVPTMKTFSAAFRHRVIALTGTEVRDFHALRNTFLSSVLAAGADLKQAMQLARHSDPRLTVARYARTQLQDLGNLVGRIPSGAFAGNQTATSGYLSDSVTPPVTPLVGNPGKHQTTIDEIEGAIGNENSPSGSVK
jgi:hypothetical protein